MYTYTPFSSLRGKSISSSMGQLYWRCTFHCALSGVACLIICAGVTGNGLITSNLPVDCANFSLTELRELQFQCYAIAVPTSLGIAVAAALGPAKVVILGITSCVKVTEWFFMMIKNPPRKLQEVCCCNCGKRQCAICMSIYINLSYLFLSAVAVITLVCGAYFILDYAKRDPDPIHITYYVAYLYCTILGSPLQ